MFYRRFVIKNLNRILKIQNGVNMVHSTDISCTTTERLHSSRKQRKDIIIIEKDRSTFRLLQLYFKKKGYSSIGVENVKEGVMMAQKMRPKLVLCEISPGGVDQFRDISELEGKKELEGTIFYYMSTLSRDDLIQYSGIEPPEKLVSKPFDFTRLDALINNI